MKLFLLQTPIPNPMPSPEQVITFQEYPYAFSLMIALGAIGVLFSILMYSSWRYNKNMHNISIEQTKATSNLANSMAAVAQATKELSHEVRIIQREHIDGINKLNQKVSEGFQEMKAYVYERTDMIHDQIQLQKQKNG